MKYLLLLLFVGVSLRSCPKPQAPEPPPKPPISDPEEPRDRPL